MIRTLADLEKVSPAQIMIVFVDRTGSVRYQGLGTRTLATLRDRTYKQPVGVIVKGSPLGNSYAVFYRGKNAEVLGENDLNHPHMQEIHDSLHMHGLRTEPTHWPPELKGRTTKMLAKKYYSKYSGNIAEDKTAEGFEDRVSRIVLGRPKRMLAQKYYSTSDPTDTVIDASWTTRKRGRGNRYF